MVDKVVAENNQTERNDQSHHEHSQLNRAFCDKIPKERGLSDLNNFLHKSVSSGFIASVGDMVDGLGESK